MLIVLLLAAQLLAEVISKFNYRDVDLDYIQLRGIGEGKVVVVNYRPSASTMYETVFKLLDSICSTTIGYSSLPTTTAPTKLSELNRNRRSS
jgi:hypothetical protein